MENQHENLCPSMRHISGAIDSEVLGDLCFENHQYLILNAKHCFDESSQNDLLLQSIYLKELSVGELKIHGQDYVIVDASNYPGKDKRSDAKNLLTAREIQIVHLVAQGLANKQVAQRLHISEWTVSTHLRRVFAKLGVDSRAAMVYRCSWLLATLESMAE